MSIKNPRIHIFIIALIYVFITSNFHWGKDNWKGVLESDAKGYYAYLPAFFIYQDPNFKFIDEIEKSQYTFPHLRYDFRVGKPDQTTSKYYIGTSICQVPFFLAGHLFAYISDTEMNGYSPWYMRWICLSSIFYACFGMFFFLKWAERHAISDKIIALLLYAIAFGTHLFVYTLVEPGMSHVYSFGLISAFIYYCTVFSENKRNSSLFILSLLLGLIVLVRPINGLIVISIPFLMGNWVQLKEFIHQLFTNKSKLIIAIVIFIALLSIQLLWYKNATGNWWLYSYGDEGFNFHSPHIIDILFSYKKGLFLYTPLFLLGTISVILNWMKSNSFKFFAWAFFIGLITYVFSSWHSWYYGGSFSSRVYVEYIPLFVLPLAVYLHRLNNWKKTLSIALVGILILVCQIQSYQYRYYEIHFSDMDKEKYWEVFLMRNKY